MNTDIKTRCKKEFVVLLHEGYDYGDWFWFPSMNADALEKWWHEQDGFADFLFHPEKLPGDLYPVEGLEDERLYLELRLSGQYYKADIETPLEASLCAPEVSEKSSRNQDVA